MTLACYLRNDGKYLVLPCGYIIAVNLKKNYKKLMLLSMVAVTLAANATGKGNDQSIWGCVEKLINQTSCD